MPTNKLYYGDNPLPPQHLPAFIALARRLRSFAAAALPCWRQLRETVARHQPIAIVSLNGGHTSQTLVSPPQPRGEMSANCFSPDKSFIPLPEFGRG